MKDEDALPIDPYDDPRFQVDDYPGGETARDRDYEAAVEKHERALHVLALQGRLGEHEQYYAHRKEVNRELEALAAETGHDGRTLSLWLVKDQGSHGGTNVN